MTPEDFAGERAILAARMFRDRSFSAVSAMEAMTALAEEYCSAHVGPADNAAVWVGGSLGRREILPNSDLDLILIYRESLSVAPQPPLMLGFDQLETGSISIGALQQLATHCLIDMNQFIDGRPLDCGIVALETTALLTEANTYDRQYANLVTEHYYFRHFDFWAKRTVHGANMKYSSGSARVTLFFNFINRILGGDPPATRGAGPEFLEGVKTCDETLGVPGPYRALDLVQLVKNAAISTFDATGDARQRYLSRRSLECIYDLCAPRLLVHGIRDRDDLLRRYVAARVEIESVIEVAVERTIKGHRNLPALEEVACAPPRSLRHALREAVDNSPADAATLLSLGVWRALTRQEASRSDIAGILAVLRDAPPPAADGALMAIGCASITGDELLHQVISLVEARSAGAYVLKLVSRNESASESVRRRAKAAYLRAEFVRTYQPH